MMNHHEALLFTKFECLQRNCCNPLRKECHAKQNNFRLITLATAKMTDLLKLNIKPGQKLCTSCRKDFDQKQPAFSKLYAPRRKSVIFRALGCPGKSDLNVSTDILAQKDLLKLNWE